MEFLKIGIVLNYKRAERKKDEMLKISSKKMSWLKYSLNKYSRGGFLHSDLLINKKNKRTNKQELYAPDDVAIGLYLEAKYPNIVIDYITPDEISTRRFKSNHLVFVVIYDLLECFHLSNRMKYNKYKNALKNSKNVYPPYEYQKFINNKCNYYKYLAKKNIPVAPTYCLTKQKWFSKDPNKYVSNLISKIKNNGWESIVSKPAYGQESIDFAKFMNCNSGNSGNSGNTNSLKCRQKAMLKYFTKVVPKYKSIVIQEYIKGFDKKNPEYRTFFINGQYMYTIVTTNTRVGLPKQEGGTFKIPDDLWKYLISFRKQIMDSLPKLDLSGIHKNPIITRIDIGSGLEDSPFGLFVNEVEFVPSLYAEELNPDKFPVITTIADSLHDVADEYRNYPKLPVKVNF